MITIALSDDLAPVHALRRAVFIEEQGIPEAEEWDDKDSRALHLLARDESGPLATARLFVTPPTGVIGRVCTARSQRGTGLGLALMRRAMAELAARGCTEVRLSAQVRVIGFYQKLGFIAQGAPYDDAGIPHRDMIAPL